jgi:FixJ family two-component response regulator
LSVEVFPSAEEFLNSNHLRRTRCLILDVRMPGMNGFELHRQLRATHRDIPVIFITAHGNEASRLQALKEGAMDYLYKPFSDEDLLNAIDAALRLEVIKNSGDGLRGARTES